MDDKKVVVNNTSRGITAFGVLGIVFVTLKLAGVTEVATWPWWLVTVPFWGGLALVLAFFAFFVVGGALIAGLMLAGAWLLDRLADYRRRKRYAKGRRQ